MTQSAFHDALLDAARPVPPGLTDGMGRPAGLRYAVYRNNIAVSLTEALATGFPAVAALLGETNFTRIAGRYLRQHPPRSPLLATYGLGFPAFLDGLDGLDRMAWLSDVARLELALRSAYHAADATPVDAEELTKLDGPALMAARLHLVPALRLVPSRWPIGDLRSYALGFRHDKPRATAQDVIVLRPEYDPLPLVLPEGGFAFVSALQAGMPLGAAVTQCGRGFEPTETLALLLGHKAIAAIEAEDAP